MLWNIIDMGNFAREALRTSAIPIGLEIASNGEEIIKIFHIKRAPRGYDAYKKIINSSQFKTHKKKWTKIYFLLLLVYVISYILIALSTKDGAWAWLVAYIISFSYLGIAKNIEDKQRKEIEKQVKEK